MTKFDDGYYDPPEDPISENPSEAELENERRFWEEMDRAAVRFEQALVGPALTEEQKRRQDEIIRQDSNLRCPLIMGANESQSDAGRPRPAIELPTPPFSDPILTLHLTQNEVLALLAATRVVVDDYPGAEKREPKLYLARVKLARQLGLIVEDL